MSSGEAGIEFDAATMKTMRSFMNVAELMRQCSTVDDLARVHAAVCNMMRMSMSMSGGGDVDMQLSEEFGLAIEAARTELRRSPSILSKVRSVLNRCE